MPWPQLQQLGPSPPHSPPRPPSPAYLRARQRSPPPFPCSVSAGPPSQKGILSLAPLERRHRSGSPEQPGVLPGAPRAVSGGWRFLLHRWYHLIVIYLLQDSSLQRQPRSGQLQVVNRNLFLSSLHMFSPFP